MNTVIVLKIQELSECLLDAREQCREINGTGKVALVLSDDGVLRVLVADKNGRFDPERNHIIQHER